MSNSYVSHDAESRCLMNAGRVLVAASRKCECSKGATTAPESRRRFNARKGVEIRFHRTKMISAGRAPLAILVIVMSDRIGLSRCLAL